MDILQFAALLKQWDADRRQHSGEIIQPATEKEAAKLGGPVARMVWKTGPRSRIIKPKRHIFLWVSQTEGADWGEYDLERQTRGFAFLVCRHCNELRREHVDRPRGLKCLFDHTVFERKPEKPELPPGWFDLSDCTEKFKPQRIRLPPDGSFPSTRILYVDKTTRWYLGDFSIPVRTETTRYAKTLEGLEATLHEALVDKIELYGLATMKTMIRSFP